MIIPDWQEALTVASKRRRITLLYQGELLTLSLIGASAGAVVLSPHRGQDLRPGDTVWIKEISPDGRTIPDDGLQFSPEGLPGIFRATERVALIEAGKGAALEREAAELSMRLLGLLKANDDRELGPLFERTLAFVELFITSRPETAERLKKENPRKVKRMLSRCLTLYDATGRKNKPSKVFGAKGAQKRLRHMSARRMATANKALTTSLTLNALMHTMYEFVTSVGAEIESKLNAGTWNMNNPTHRRWLKRFGERISAWANEFGKMDMHPFAHDAKKAQSGLKDAAKLIQILPTEINISEIQEILRWVFTSVKRLEVRFQVAEMLRVVGTAQDARVVQFGISVQKPTWDKIRKGILTACDTFGIERALYEMGENADPTTIHAKLDDIAKYYDNASRAAA